MTRRITLVLAFALTTWLAGSCGGDDDVVEGEMPVFGGGGGAAQQAPSASTPAGGGDTSSVQAGQVSSHRISQMEFAEGARDPFMRAFPEGETPLAIESVEIEPTGELDLGPLANYPVESLRLMGVVTRTPEPRAMFLLPDGSGRAVLARPGDRVGPEGTGRITDIQPNRVIVSYEELFEFNEEGTQARTLVLTLRDPSQYIEAEFEPY